MPVEIVVPELGESILEATVGQWLKNEGDPVEVGEALVELETDKVNIEVSAVKSGVLRRIERKEQEDVKVGDVLGVIEESGEPAGTAYGEPPRAAAQQDGGAGEREAAETVAVPQQPEAEPAAQEEKLAPARAADLTPVARRLIEEQGIDPAEVPGTGPGGRVTRADVEAFIATRTQPPKPEPAAQEARTAEVESRPPAAPAPAAPPQPAAQPPAPAVQLEDSRGEERIKMSRRRRTIATRLKEVQNTAAILSTFNEVDMSNVMEMRKRRGEDFLKRYGIKLGFMSFFVKAVIGALRAFPHLNAELQGDEMIIKHYYDIGIAIGAEEGLVVPVLRDADRMTFAEVEKAIEAYAIKARENRLTLDDLRGGTFTITNGGVFGSLLSTPILTPPQVGILGMHKIERRPIVMGDEIVIRPMMYVALSYDHRIVDGREAVQFLVRVKELIEDPETMLLEG